jgi:hypothetical protein
LQLILGNIPRLQQAFTQQHFFCPCSHTLTKG